MAYPGLPSSRSRGESKLGRRGDRPVKGAGRCRSVGKTCLGPGGSRIIRLTRPAFQDRQNHAEKMIFRVYGILRLRLSLCRRCFIPGLACLCAGPRALRRWKHGGQSSPVPIWRALSNLVWQGRSRLLYRTILKLKCSKFGPGGGNGRHKGFKIPRPTTVVPVQFRPWAPIIATKSAYFPNL